MNGYKRFALLLLVLLIVMQFIQPKKNITSNLPGNNDITQVYAVPAVVKDILINKCYDCHSNNTHYPWYFNVQPIGWWLAAHVHEGKEHLNFSEFKTYKPERARHKLEEIWEVTEDKSMPLPAYTSFHEGTKLTDADERAIGTWLRSLNIPIN